MIQYKDVILIGDLYSLSESKINQEYMQYSPDVNPVNKDMKQEKEYRSIVVTKKGTFYSIISSNTLKERLNKAF